MKPLYIALAVVFGAIVVVSGFSTTPAPAPASQSHKQTCEKAGGHALIDRNGEMTSCRLGDTYFPTH